MHARTYACRKEQAVLLQQFFFCLCVCVDICIIHMCIHLHIHTYMDVFVHARLYACRKERTVLLQRARARIQSTARLSNELGVMVEAAQEGWLERQQHDQLRDLNNLGF